MRGLRLQEEGEREREEEKEPGVLRTLPARACGFPCRCPRFHMVSYRLRMGTVALLMAASYSTVALSSRRGWQLLGVVFASLQVGHAVLLSAPACLPLPATR